MNEIEKLRALLAEARAITQDSLDANTTGFDVPGEICECHSCERYRSIIQRIDAALAEPVERYTDCERESCEYRRVAEELMAAQVKVAKERDEARAHLAAVEKLLPREEYLSDKTLAENLAGYIEGLKHAHAEAVAAFHDATRLRSIIQQARIKAEDERDEARARADRLQKLVDETAVRVTELLVAKVSR